jgi:hypothetical protein
VLSCSGRSPGVSSTTRRPIPLSAADAHRKGVHPSPGMTSRSDGDRHAAAGSTSVTSAWRSTTNGRKAESVVAALTAKPAQLLKQVHQRQPLRGWLGLIPSFAASSRSSSSVPRPSRGNPYDNATMESLMKTLKG